MSYIHLQVDLSEDRNQSGIMVVKDKQKVITRFECLGRGSQGPGDTQLQVKGNTPAGEYNVSKLETTANWNQSSYGPNGALRLDPVSGNALAAEQVVGRKGLLIHGGTTGGNNYWRGAGELRATHGCIRLSNENMRRLQQIIFDESLDPDRMQSVNVRIMVSVVDHPMSFMRP